MCITSETCRANSVIKTALNNLHQAGPNKTHIDLINCLLTPHRILGYGGSLDNVPETRAGAVIYLYTPPALQTTTDLAVLLS